MEFSGLEDLGDDYVYEGWLMDSAGTVTSAGLSCRFRRHAFANVFPH